MGGLEPTPNSLEITRKKLYVFCLKVDIQTPVIF